MAAELSLETVVVADRRELVCKMADIEICRMYVQPSNTGNALVLQVSPDCGDASFDLALAIFKHQRAFGSIN